MYEGPLALVGYTDISPRDDCELGWNWSDPMSAWAGEAQATMAAAKPPTIVAVILKAFMSSHFSLDSQWVVSQCGLSVTFGVAGEEPGGHVADLRRTVPPPGPAQRLGSVDRTSARRCQTLSIRGECQSEEA
jgi:hypothetical protein